MRWHCGDRSVYLFLDGFFDCINEINFLYYFFGYMILFKLS